MRKYIYFLPLLFFTILGVCFYSYLGKDATIIPSATINKNLPEMHVRMLETPESAIKISDVSQSPYLLNIWASWCTSCVKEHQALQQLHANGIKIIGVAYKDEIKQAREWLRRYGNPYELTLIDTEGDFAFELGVYGVPETYLISADGMILHKWIGELKQNMLNDIIEQFKVLND